MRSFQGLAGVALVGVVLLLSAACENEDSDILGLKELAETDIPTSLSRDVQPIFTQTCALSGCHAGSLPAANLILETGRLFDAQTGIVNVASDQRFGLMRVLPGDAESSYLVNKLEGTQGSVGGGGERMPVGLPPLSESAIDVVRRWIDEGALDN